MRIKTSTTLRSSPSSTHCLNQPPNCRGSEIFGKTCGRWCPHPRASAKGSSRELIVATSNKESSTGSSNLKIRQGRGRTRTGDFCPWDDLGRVVPHRRPGHRGFPGDEDLPTLPDR